jgi:hypothetical protein
MPYRACETESWSFGQTLSFFERCRNRAFVEARVFDRDGGLLARALPAGLRLRDVVPLTPAEAEEREALHRP